MDSKTNTNHTTGEATANEQSSHADQMGKANFQRTDMRSEVTQTGFRGIANAEGGDLRHPFILWDVSDQGVKIWLPYEAAEGTVLTLTMTKPLMFRTSGKVMWCRSVKDEAGAEVGWHAGIRILDDLPSLVALHKECLEHGAPE